MRNIGIITSGGDCGGLNAVISGAAKVALNMGIKLFVIPNGYAGLYNLKTTEKLTELSQDRIEKVHSALAGSEAGHSRVKIRNIQDPRKYEIIKEGLDKFEIDGLIISGGDDTGSVIVDLDANHIPCVHAPKTMDLDLQTYSVGADSTINRISQFAEDLKTTGMSHNRAIVMEVFGRYAGHTAFKGGIGADADCILIPEIPVDFDIVYEHYKRIFTNRVLTSDVRAGTYVIIVAEGIKTATGSHITDETVGLDSFGHKKLSGAAKYVREQLEKRLSADESIPLFMKNVGQYVKTLYERPEIREVNPGHLVRSGGSTSYDVAFGKSVGGAAVKLLVNGTYGVTVAGVFGSDIHYMKTADAIKQRLVDLDEISLYEEMDICFGRRPVHFQPKFTEIVGKVWRHL
ncbi:MAG: 6-phosphofructokinase [Bdellovibrionales bacterium RIFOXYD12_FULL_39_22]|nr:MAG: 6-phosphofructokinase [Bdellovibrionales bacterium RIFOXYB1_FULL_39_21]OFZ44281.1 MAG: 6-phosphofructokinase [Bdellovibrionales bacterium RIFOXYC12_FULL_39_17]OFZ46829.1 MAG: 6-phosphofructokinase [Bdellovibrionales bacterium RIFOXYC1_FULL_39_130]OFZ76095.1 MAG: 6-phosphofructokinase [Bdellovibrionales bacterium RIFOXYD1_FULL_39_84]OFZ95502.1 MAG: 6-phosphofructokinase [Bdellovibrionales bacterium RIFOXYD12_FULL_39_22]